MNGAGKLIVFVVLLLVGGSLWFSLRRDPHARALEARAVATEILAQEVTRRFPNSKALVISNPFAQKAGVRKEIEAVETAGIRGLKRGFGTAATVEAIVYPDIRAEARDNPRAIQIPDTTTPLSYLIAPDSFDKLFGQHPSCDLVVSLIGLPADLSAVELWQRPSTPRFALLLPDLRMIENEAALHQAMQSGKLVAFVLRKPEGVPDYQPLAGNSHDEFEQRFILVTAENLADILKRYPDLFPFKARGQ